MTLANCRQRTSKHVVGTPPFTLMKHIPAIFLILGVIALFSTLGMAATLDDLASLLKDSSGWTAPKALVLKEKPNASLRFIAMRNYMSGAESDNVTAQLILSLDRPPPEPKKAVSGIKPPDGPNLTVQGFSGYYEEAATIHRITLSLCVSKAYSCSFMASGTASREQLLSLVRQLSLAKVAAIAAEAFR
jgi:hypothetical protein